MFSTSGGGPPRHEYAFTVGGSMIEVADPAIGPCRLWPLALELRRELWALVEEQRKRDGAHSD